MGATAKAVPKYVVCVVIPLSTRDADLKVENVAYCNNALEAHEKLVAARERYHPFLTEVYELSSETLAVAGAASELAPSLWKGNDDDDE